MSAEDRSIDERPDEAATAAEVEAARDATNWAKHVSRLEVAEVPEGAINLNVEGRRLTGPIQGFGKMWQKTYQVTLPRDAVAPTDLVATWKKRFPEYWPSGNRFYASLTGIAPGEIALLDLSMAGPVKLSTGVMVLYADEESFTLMTPEGHVFAGWITFSAAEREGTTVAQIQVLMRASDPLFELGMPIMGHRNEDRFWQRTLGALATHFGQPAASVESTRVCIDNKRQWGKAGNIRHNAAIRTMLHYLSAPIRWATRALRRSGSSA
jgi:hypothetical protein